MTQTIVIGHIGLIQESKKQHFTLELINRLTTNGYDVIGLFAGECRDLDYLKELNHMVEKNHLSKQVLFLGRRDDVQDLLKIIDMLIIPSSFEGFPLVGLEAAAAGVPVIACSVAGAEELISVSGDGVTFLEDDVTSAIEAVNEALKNSNTYSKSGKEFANKMSLKNYKERLETLFSFLVSRI